MTKRTRYAVTLVFGLACGACHSARPLDSGSTADAADSGGAAGSSQLGDSATVTVGTAFERTCDAKPQGITLPTTALTCTLLTDVARVRMNLTTTGNVPLMAVTFGGIEPQRHSTDDQSMTDVILQGPCPARAQGSSQPCTVELLTLTRGPVPAATGKAEPGSALELRVSCPASLTDATGDSASNSQQSPRAFEITAQDCVVY